MEIQFREHTAKPAAAKEKSAIVTVVTVADGNRLSARGKELDKLSGGALTAALSGRFTGKKGQTALLISPSGIGGKLVLLGVGEEKKLDILATQSLGGKLVTYLNSIGAAEAEVALEDWSGAKTRGEEFAAHFAYGALLKSYRFDKYRTKEKPEDKPTLTALSVETRSARQAQKAFEPLERIARSVFFTRDLVSEPANVLYPESFAAAAKELSALGVEVKVLNEAQMKKLGMNALLGVGQGSARESQLVTMQWKGGRAGDAPLCFVGKGVCFDSGGISIKPANGMEEMKWDMGGAGTVTGLIRALAARKAKVNAVGVIGLVENMPDGNAQRPGDVVISMSGQSIEVINTDAEGRLVLADALWYAQEHFKPKLVVDLATLTGAIIIALGTSRAGLFANDDKLAQQLFEAGKETGEDVWRLPLGEVYDKQINCDIADMRNIGEGREAGSITAAQFLQRFIKEGTPWAHLDIAGVAWTSKEQDTCPKGATGFGIRLLNALVAEHYEK
jgi:leucyl aminopeptidase